jgi:hypothetical protein
MKDSNPRAEDWRAEGDDERRSSTVTQRSLFDSPTVDLTPRSMKRRTNGTQWEAADHSRGLFRDQNLSSEEQDAEIGVPVEAAEPAN